MVKFENIEIKYGDFVAIENLNLDIKEYLPCRQHQPPGRSQMTA